MAEPPETDQPQKTPAGPPTPFNRPSNFRTVVDRPNILDSNSLEPTPNQNEESVPRLSVPNRVVKTYREEPSGVNRARVATKAAGTTAAVAGTGMQVAGKGMEVAGKGMQAAGRGVQAAGSAIAAIPVPIVAQVAGGITAGAGIGLQAAGAGTQVAGRATNAAGKGVRRAGNATRRAAGNSMVSRVSTAMGTKTKDDSKVTPARLSLRRKIESDPTGRLQQRYLNKATNLIPNPAAKAAAKFAIKNVKRVKTAAITIEIFAWATTFWLWFQLPLAVISLIMFGLISTAGDILGFGFDPDVLFSGMFFVIWIIGFATLIIMAFQYIWTGTSCFFGKGALLKFGSFILATFFYMLPFLNLFPWFMVWALFVNRYPE